MRESHFKKDNLESRSTFLTISSLGETSVVVSVGGGGGGLGDGVTGGVFHGGSSTNSAGTSAGLSADERDSDCILHGYVKKQGGPFGTAWQTR